MAKKYRMHPDFPAVLAAKLKKNPNLMEETDDLMLGELILHYAEGELSLKDQREVKKMLKKDPRAREILESIKKADAFSKSEAGKVWLENLKQKIMGDRIKKQ